MLASNFNNKKEHVAYSLDLRERVIATVDSGIRINEVVKTFKVSRRVIYEWLELRRKTGNLVPRMDNIKGRSPKIKDWDQFRKFAADNQQSTGPEMVAAWKKLTEIQMCDSAMYRSLNKINYTSKKKPLTTLKQTKKNVKDF